ncbi:MAG: hypothetical protein V7K98_12420 [Nostoc sp.]|uniref:hypothetical protein n=1 Tax=Nostoc sp. TaxID=1180 RepID=UPI002FFB87B0
MTQTNCPRCDSTRLQHQEDYGYWECDDCGHAWALDADDPDYDESENDCPRCLGTGWVGIHGADECPVCGGCGYV